LRSKIAARQNCSKITISIQPLVSFVMN
jgi:hypothetical protein